MGNGSEKDLGCKRRTSTNFAKGLGKEGSNEGVTEMG